MLFDKRRCLAGVQRADELNHDPESYQHVYGDKDLFPIGCLANGNRLRLEPARKPGPQPHDAPQRF